MSRRVPHMTLFLLWGGWLTNWTGNPLWTGRGHCVYSRNCNDVCANATGLSVLTRAYKNALADISLHSCYMNTFQFNDFYYGEAFLKLVVFLKSFM